MRLGGVMRYPFEKVFRNRGMRRYLMPFTLGIGMLLFVALTTNAMG